MRIETAITLYAHPNHHLSHRVLLAMALKNLDYNVIWIRNEHDDAFADLADINPYNSTPTLVERELVLYESRVILDYLEERFKGTKLLPDNPHERAMMRQYAWRLEKDWLMLANKLLTHKDSICLNEQAKARETLANSFITMSPLFASKPFFMNDSFGLCDCLLAPVLWRLDEMQINLPRQLCKPLMNYCDRLFDMPEFKESIK